MRATVADDQAGMRLDAFVALAADVPRARASELIERDAVTVDGEVRGRATRVAAGQMVEIGAVEDVAVTYDVPPLMVVYEDDHVLVLDKPAGVVVHPARGLQEGTLVDALIASGRPLAAGSAPERPGVLHRLDREVSGLLAVAKTDRAYEVLQADLAARRMRREYLALVAGAPQVDTGKIDAPVGRHPTRRTKMAVVPDGRPSVTFFRVRKRYDQTTLLEVRLETGRTHQIRVHLASIGLPICGDRVYGRRWPGIERPFLHAFRLSFTHPATGQDVVCESTLPAELAKMLEP